MISFWFLIVGALLLGAILAPIDPVLASDVQVRNADDRNRSRFTLTAEGGFNDGIAFPFVILGLGLLGLGELGPFGLRWVAVDLMWAAGVTCETAQTAGRRSKRMRIGEDRAQ